MTNYYYLSECILLVVIVLLLDLKSSKYDYERTQNNYRLEK